MSEAKNSSAFPLRHGPQDGRFVTISGNIPEAIYTRRSPGAGPEPYWLTGPSETFSAEYELHVENPDVQPVFRFSKFVAAPGVRK